MKAGIYIVNIYAIHKAKKCNICGSGRTSLEYLSANISYEHLKSDNVNKLRGGFEKTPLYLGFWPKLV